MNALVMILTAAILFGKAAGEDGMPLVEQEVDCISVAHIDDGVSLVFFWARVQGEWVCLDHRWRSSEMAVSRSGGRFVLAWPDDCDSCYRVVFADAWIESWERQSPLAAESDKPWHARLLEPGLKRTRGPF